jgi:ubiquinone/menaquinone biosynthesis C-methylase UbiE
VAEQPEGVRRDTIAEALRVVKPGGQLVIVDYHRPHALHPFYLPMTGVLRALEPFALDLWRHDVTEWFPAKRKIAGVEKNTMFGGLYQLLKVTV